VTSHSKWKSLVTVMIFIYCEKQGKKNFLEKISIIQRTQLSFFVEIFLLRYEACAGMQRVVASILLLKNWEKTSSWNKKGSEIWLLFRCAQGVLQHLIVVSLCPRRAATSHGGGGSWIANGARGGTVGWDTALQAGRLQAPFPTGSLEVFIDIILPTALWPWGRLSL
jgi:hypothetical protein